MAFHDPVYEKALNDRDWAPPCGTSMNRARELNDNLSRQFRAALKKAVAAEPGLNMRDDHSMPWLWCDNDEDETGGWWVACGITHEIRDSEDNLRTFLWASWVSDADPPVERPRPIDTRLAGRGGRNASRLARMVVDALRPYSAP